MCALSVDAVYVECLRLLARRFEKRYSDRGETYLLLKWCDDGYELHVCKTRDANVHFRILDKPTLRLLVEEKVREVLQPLIQKILFKNDRQAGEKLFEELPHILKIQKTFFIYKDGSFAPED